MSTKHCPIHYVYDAQVVDPPESTALAAAKYRTKVEAFTRGDLSAEAFRPEHVAMGIYELRTPGRYMVRVRIAAGRVLPRQLRGIALLSSTYGNGVLHVTTRQDIQIHDVAIGDTPHIIEGLLAEGLSTRGSGGNTVRNVTACTRSGICANERFDVGPYALAVSRFFLGHEGSFTLPRKFKVAFSGCPEDCALASVADVGFFAEVRDGERGFRVYAGGGLGSNARGGIEVGEFIPAGDCIRLAEAVRRVFDKYGDRTNRNRARLRYVLNRLGDDEFAVVIGHEAGCVECETVDVSATDSAASPRSHGSSYASGKSYVFPEKRPGLFTIELRLPMGEITADDLIAVSHCAEAYGEGVVRTTQLQDILITGVPGSEIPPLLDSLKTLSVNLSRPAALKTIACAGASTCRLGLCRSRDLAAAIAAAPAPDAANGIAPGQCHPPVRISGCHNSCAAHQVADIGLEGRLRRVGSRLMPCYTVYGGGKPSADGARLGKKLGVVPAKRVPELVTLIYKEGVLEVDRLSAVVRSFEQLPPEIPEDWFIDFGPSDAVSTGGNHERH